MGASECHHPEATAPPAVQQALCAVCKEAAVQRCEDCFDEEDGHLFLCAKDACFVAQHGERESLRRKHRKSLVAWDSRAQWTDKCCATHKGNVLALWCVDCSTVVCALCCLLGGEHTGHSTSPVIDAWEGIQEQLQAAMGPLEAENAKNRERLRQLREEQDGLASGNGAVGDARRALEEVKALFLAKVDALSGELDETAERWSRQVAAEHEQLAQLTRSVQALVDDMRATCAEEKAEEAQRVAIAHRELCGRRDALERAPPVSVRALEFDAAPLREAVAEVFVRTIVCAECGSGVREYTAPCDVCAEAVRAFVAGGRDIRNASDSLRANKAILLAAVAEEGHSFKFASEKLQADKELALAAIAQDAFSLQYATSELKADKEVVLAAIARDAFSFVYASEELRGDKDVVLTAVAQHAFSFEYATAELQADKEVVLAVVAQDGRSLQHASEELRDNKEVVLTAIAENCRSLQFASKALKADREVLRAAAAQGRLPQHANKELEADESVRRAARL